MAALKHVFRYLKGTQGRHLFYSKATMPDSDSNSPFTIEVYVDSDWANDKSDRKSYSGYLIYLNGQLIDWICKKQYLTATSTAEAEYIALSIASKSCLHVYQLIAEFFPITHPCNVFCDSTSAIMMAENNLTSNRSKHIWILFRFITDWIEKKLIKVYHIDGKTNQADFLTKVPQAADFATNSKVLFKALPIPSIGGVLECHSHLYV